MSWSTIAGKELTLLSRELGISRSKTNLSASRRPMPFYRHGSLVKVQRGEREMFLVSVENDTGRYIPLTGSVEAIAEANREAALEITEQNVREYLTFFCGFLHDPGGRAFTIVEELTGFRLLNDDPQGLPPEDMSIVSTWTGEAFHCIAYMQMGRELFRVELVVRKNGAVEMTDDELLGLVVPRH